MLVGDDADTLAPAQARHEIVHDDAVDPRADQADDHQAERVHEEGRAADDHARDRHRQPDVEMQVLVDDLGEDVQAARRGVDAEHDGLGHAQDEHEADQVEPEVAHHGGGTGSEERRIGADLLPQVHHRAEDQRRVAGLEPELLADQEIGHDQQDGVDDEHDRGHLDGEAGLLEEGADDDRQTRDAADDDLARDEEVVHGRCGDKHADGHDQKLLPELPSPERSSDVLNFHVVRIGYRWLVSVW